MDEKYRDGVKKRYACTFPTCDAEWDRESYAKAHWERKHGVYEADPKGTTSSIKHLKTLTNPNLINYIIEEGRALNTNQARVKAMEDRLRVANPGYQPKHGLKMDGPPIKTSVTDYEANTRVQLAGILSGIRKNLYNEQGNDKWDTVIEDLESEIVATE